MVFIGFWGLWDGNWVIFWVVGWVDFDYVFMIDCEYVLIGGLLFIKKCWVDLLVVVLFDGIFIYLLVFCEYICLLLIVLNWEFWKELNFIWFLLG